MIKKFLGRESSVVVKHIIGSRDVENATKHFFENLLNKEDNPIIMTLDDPNIKL